MSSPKSNLDLRAPLAGRPYPIVLEAAEAAGLGKPFRALAMLLQMPWHMKPVELVFTNFALGLKTIPCDWQIPEALVTMGEAADWFLANVPKLEAASGTRFNTEPRQRNAGGVSYYLHPMDREGLTFFPIFSVMCDVHECSELQPSFAALQFQFLLARFKELDRNVAHNPKGYESSYENNVGTKDFARNVRSPYPASHAIRQLSKRVCSELLLHMHTERSPEKFAASLTEVGIPRSINELDFGALLKVIKNYCLVESGSNAGGVRARGKLEMPPWRHAYISYNETRFGTQIFERDEYDASLNIPDQELIRERIRTVQQALEEDCSPDELLASGGYVLDGTDQREEGPPPFGTIRLRRHLSDIDVFAMPWSASHLRPRELQETLFAELATLSQVTEWTDQERSSRLAFAALAVTTLESSRQPMQCLSLAISATPTGDLCLIPSRSPEQRSQWCFRAIQPLYREERPTLGCEVDRVSHLFYPVEPVAEQILLTYWRLKGKPRSRLFDFDPNTVERDLNRWLRTLDPSGRLTFAKLARLKMTLLTTAARGDKGQASLTLGVPHPDARVALHYLLISVERALYLHSIATAQVWGEAHGGSGLGAQA